MENRLMPPAVPAKLQELLQDYPEYIDRLQNALAPFAVPKLRLQPFDDAIWALESVLDGFVDEANYELDAAQSTGGVEEIERAKEKRRLMLLAQSRGAGLSGRSLQGLWEYFQQNKEAYE
ncbi:hypothetical protein [Lysobacter sp. CA196]|uniref:hypothetical protein n=1 Tax=Lysobacter sp. CA196 TaxID=3455606 RepID=UPI003F8D5693